MKNIVTIISFLLFIAGSVFLDMFLSEDNKDVTVVIKQYAYEPVSAQLCNVKTKSLPFDKCNPQKQVEGTHVENARFASVRKIISRHNFFAPLYFLNKHSATLLPVSNKVQSSYIGYAGNNLPIHLRNCIWLI